MPRFATADVGDDASVAGLAEQIGPVQVLVNAGATPNAGGFPESELSDHINVKVQGALRTARAFAPGMVAAGWGAAPLPDQGGAAGRGDRAVGREGRGHRVPGARPAARAGARPPR
jgi:NAD(P)-dependent dehydrogenase (short-subunit alcohol dehydrogenase family)